MTKPTKEEKEILGEIEEVFEAIICLIRNDRFNVDIRQIIETAFYDGYDLGYKHGEEQSNSVKIPVTIDKITLSTTYSDPYNLGNQKFLHS
jgi:hypothetical protein